MEEKKYEYKVEIIKKRKKSNLEISVIILSFIFFIVFMIYSNINSLTPSKQDDFLETVKEIEKYIEYNYMSCKNNNNDYNNEILTNECILLDNYSSNIIKELDFSKEDIDDIIINLGTRKMRVNPGKNGKFSNANYIEVDLHID